MPETRYEGKVRLGRRPRLSIAAGKLRTGYTTGDVKSKTRSPAPIGQIVCERELES